MPEGDAVPDALAEPVTLGVSVRVGDTLAVDVKLGVWLGDCVDVCDSLPVGD